MRSQDDQTIGRLSQFVVDPVDGVIKFALVTTGGFASRDILVPRAALAPAAYEVGAVRLRLRLEEVAVLPTYLPVGRWGPPPAGLEPVYYWLARAGRALRGLRPYALGRRRRRAQAPPAHVPKRPATPAKRGTRRTGAAHPRWLVTIGRDTHVRRWDGRSCGRAQAVTFDESTGGLSAVTVRAAGQQAGQALVQVHSDQLAKIGDDAIWLREPDRASSSASGRHRRRGAVLQPLPETAYRRHLPAPAAAPAERASAG